MTSMQSVPHTAFRLAVLLLAAGQGSRLGSYPKALLKKNGQSLLKRFCSALATFAPVECVVVTGFHADQIESEIQLIKKTSSFPISMIRNLSSKEGQPTSVRLGLESLRSQYDVLLVALSDQPGVGVLEIQALLDGFEKKDHASQIVLPIVSGKRGNPVAFSSSAVQAILATPDMVCRNYMDSHPEQVCLLETDLQGFILDVDTFDDIQREKLTLS